MDRIVVRDLRVKSRIGVTGDERAAAQDLLINVELERDLTAAGASDDLADTIDYGWVIGEIAAIAEMGERQLLEKLADEIARRMSALEGVRGVTVEVLKVAPPVTEDVGPTGVRIERP
jgi:dihydroneopterin aldolase